jgi:hypothetical protein
MSKEIADVIYAYLKVYSDAPLRGVPDPSSETISVLRKNPKESFRLIADYRGKRPRHLDPRDLGDPLVRLLAGIADLVPELLLARMSKGFWVSRYLFICAAAASQSQQFVPSILGLLVDRSIYIKTLVLRLIAQWPHLQVADALPNLEKLSKMKTFQDSDFNQGFLEKARASIGASS